MPKRRGNNEGTVYKRRDGKWVGAVTLGYNEQGNPKRRVVYGKTRAEAARKLSDLLDKFNKGLLAEPSSVTVAEFAKEWVGRETAGKAGNTRRNYQTELNHALKYLGAMRLQAVKPSHIRGMLDRMVSEGYAFQPRKGRGGFDKPREPKPYSPRTQKKTLERTSAMFKDAVRLELIYRNPCEAIKVKAPPSEPVGRTLEPWEVMALLKAADAHPLGLFFRLVLDTGLRRAEALALTWADIDLEALPPRLKVNKGWTKVTNLGEMTKPKTKRSRRVLPIPPDTAERLRVLHIATAQTYGLGITGLYLFGSPVDNRPIHPHTPNTVLAQLITKASIGHCRIHDLRHTYGSVMLAKGVPLEVVSERMGHANPSITLNVYRHLLESERTDYVMGITEALEGETQTRPTTRVLPTA